MNKYIFLLPFLFPEYSGGRSTQREMELPYNVVVVVGDKNLHHGYMKMSFGKRVFLTLLKAIQFVYTIAILSIEHVSHSDRDRHAEGVNRTTSDDVRTSDPTGTTLPQRLQIPDNAISYDPKMCRPDATMQQPFSAGYTSGELDS